MKLTADIVKRLRELVWDEGYGYREAAVQLDVDPDLSWTSLWAAVRGLTWKTAGGPTGGRDGRHPTKRRKKDETQKRAP